MNDEQTPDEVRAIAKYWGGEGASVWEAADGVWHFRCADPEDGFGYGVWAPGVPFPCFEDSGRPCGSIVVPHSWCVRGLNDAPDSWWTVHVDGTYEPYGRPEEKLW